MGKIPTTKYSDKHIPGSKEGAAGNIVAGGAGYPAGGGKYMGPKTGKLKAKMVGQGWKDIGQQVKGR